MKKSFKSHKALFAYVNPLSSQRFSKLRNLLVFTQELASLEILWGISDPGWSDGLKRPGEPSNEGYSSPLSVTLFMLA